LSIRLRFTLVYSAILAITLAVFGFALFSIQSQSTLDSLKNEIRKSSDTLDQSVLNSVSSVPNGDVPPPQGSAPPAPKSFQDFSTDQGLQQIPEREIVRILDTNGNLVASPYGRAEDILPLSKEGLQILQKAQTVWETATINGQKMLIYSRPILSAGKVTSILQVARSLAERDNSLNILATTLVMASAIILVIAFGVGWLFSGFVMKPIKHITQTAQSIGQESDFSKRVNYKGPQDEVGELATTFNSMLVRLQDSYQRMAQALELQQNFVADVSHELRTPLTTLRGNLELLRRTPPIPDEEQVDIRNDMVEESDRLIRLVNDLLTLARADAGRNRDLQKVLVKPCVSEVIRQSLIVHEKRKILKDIPSDAEIYADRDAFKQILLILVDNALKYSKEEIEINVVENDFQTEIRVKDHGTGLSSEKLEHVFDRFYRNEDTANVTGFGLGLAIAKSLAETQNGDILMTSEFGKGSEVTLRFPTRQ
jgi:two-component system, OmpR family, sensor kinase